MLLQYYSVLQSTTPVLLCTTKYYSSTTLYYSVLLHYYFVLHSATPVLLCTTNYYSSTTLYYKILLQYYSVLQSTTLYNTVLLCTTQYYSSTTLYYKVLLQYYSALYYILKKSRAEHLCAEISLQQVRLFAAALNMASFRTKKCDGYCSHDFYGNHGTRGPQSTGRRRWDILRHIYIFTKLGPTRTILLLGLSLESDLDHSPNR